MNGTAAILWHIPHGLAHRGLCIANTVDTRFGLAIGTKGLTAVTVMTLVESGELELAAGAVLSNTTAGAWPIVRHLDELLAF